MTRHDRIMDVLADALELDASERPAFLDRACAGDVELKSEVEKLLGAEKAAASAIPDSHPAAAAIAQVAEQHAPPPPGAEKDLLGTVLGPYTFKEVIGQGGMGVVYRARDSRLDRDVAIKALPPALSSDPHRLNRLLREARILAQLSHPNVATIFGLEESPTGGKFVVMELMLGQTLSRRISRGAMPMQEALEIASKICSGVEAAHAAGVVHRDLKPGNIMLTAEGMVKVMDFGIARDAHRHDGKGVNQSWMPGMPTNSATMPANAALTREGAIMGTPGYMPPEQLRGQKVDRRADVFAFGCVLYEMLTGENAFAGKTTEDLDKSVLELEPDWAKLPARTPVSLKRLLDRCLVKDPEKRLRDLGDARLDIDEALVNREWTKPSVKPKGSVQPIHWLGWIIALAACAITIALYTKPRAVPIKPTEYHTQQFALAFPHEQEQTDLSRLGLALSRDGSKLAISASDGRTNQIFIRDRGEIEFVALEDTTNATLPTFSADAQWLAYSDRGALTKLRLNGGTPIKVSPHTGYFGRMTWGSDDVITHAQFPGTGLTRIASEGGKSTSITQTSFDKNEIAHLQPFVTADNRWLLFSAWAGSGETKIIAKDLTTQETHLVIEKAASPRVVNTPRGMYLLFARGQTIFAAQWDGASAKTTTPEQPVIDGVLTDRAMYTNCFDAADDGTLAYVAGPEFEEESRLIWMTSDGGARVFNDDRKSFAEPHFAASGTKMSVILKGPTRRPHIYDLRTGRWDRVVIDGDVSTCAISPDGLSLAYAGNAKGTYQLFIRDLASGQDTLVVKDTIDLPQQVQFSNDGENLVFSMPVEPGGARDIWAVALDERKLSRLTNTPANESSPRFSPDGKWIAYASDESGQREVRVRAFPSGAPDRQISNGGGEWPEWSPRGARLYYRNGNNLMVVEIDKSTGTAIGRAENIYNRRFGQADIELSSYAVAPDGKLLLIEPSERAPTVSRINLVLNWFALLKDAAK